MNGKTFIAQLTDLHIVRPGERLFGRVDTAACLRTAIDSVRRLRQRPDAVVLTGDVTESGRPEEYRHLASLLAPLGMPVYLLAGNHDDRAALRAAFPAHAYLGDGVFLQYSVRVGGLRLVALDSLQVGEGGGVLCERRLAWLEAELARDTRTPTVIAMHHPPFATMIGHMDGMGLTAGARELERLVSQHPNVERIICGHLHRTIFRRFGGTIASTCPSPAHQVALDLAGDAPVMWEVEPPGFQLHAWSADAGLVTHVAHTGEFPGPFPFS